MTNDSWLLYFHLGMYDVCLYISSKYLFSYEYLNSVSEYTLGLGMPIFKKKIFPETSGKKFRIFSL